MSYNNILLKFAHKFWIAEFHTFAIKTLFPTFWEKMRIFCLKLPCVIFVINSTFSSWSWRFRYFLPGRGAPKPKHVLTQTVPGKLQRGSPHHTGSCWTAAEDTNPGRLCYFLACRRRHDFKWTQVTDPERGAGDRYKCAFTTMSCRRNIMPRNEDYFKWNRAFEG